MKNVIVLFFVSFFITNCATIFSGTHDNITINTEPKGAKVKIDGFDAGRTPLTIQVKKKMGNSTVNVSKKGYHSSNFMITRSVDLMTGLNFFNAFNGIIIDALSGALMKADKHVYEVELEKK